MTEQYLIYYNIKEGDYYTFGEQEIITITIPKNCQEKNNHELATQQFLKKKPSANVRRVDYV